QFPVIVRLDPGHEAVERVFHALAEGLQDLFGVGVNGLLGEGRLVGVALLFGFQNGFGWWLLPFLLFLFLVLRHVLIIAVPQKKLRGFVAPANAQLSRGFADNNGVDSRRAPWPPTTTRSTRLSNRASRSANRAPCSSARRLPSAGTRRACPNWWS